MDPWVLMVLLIGALLTGGVVVAIRGRQTRRFLALQHAVVQGERIRIARDLHDDLGALLTEITMLATGRTAAPECREESLAVIAQKARASLEALDSIVWAINPAEDTLESLVDYTVAFTREYLTHAGIGLRTRIAAPLPACLLTSSSRHQFFRAIKEALNNAVRHANATEIILSIECAERQLQVSVADNGRGFTWASIKPGNGLRNLQARMEQISGSCNVHTATGGGTLIVLTLPLSSQLHSPLS